MSNTVLVEFDNIQHVFETVVMESEESLWVESEGISKFVIEYQNQEAFDREIIRFNGLINFSYTV